MSKTWNPVDIVRFFNKLDECDSIIIDEGRNQKINLNNYKSVNPTNSSMHYVLIHNQHRIVLQIHKNGHREGLIDVVQGKPESDSFFIDLLNEMNSDPRFNDYYLNKLFILYNICYNMNVNFIDFFEFESFNFIINNNLVGYFDGQSWGIYTNTFEISTPNTVSVDEVQDFLYLVDCFKEICKD